MEEGGEAHDVDIGIVLAPFFQLFFHVDLCLWLTHIVGQLMRRVFPVVRDKIVHMYGIPDQECEEADGVLVVRDGFNHDLPRSFVVLPALCRDDFACRPVHDLPPPLWGVQCVHLELFRVEAFHEPDAEGLPLCRDTVADQVFLLDLLRVLHRPGVVLARGVVGCIDLGVLVQKRFGHGGAVTVAQGVRAQQIFQADRLIDHIHVCRQCQSACVFHIHFDSLLFRIVIDIFCCINRGELIFRRVRQALSEARQVRYCADLSRSM